MSVAVAVWRCGGVGVWLRPGLGLELGLGSRLGFGLRLGLGSGLILGWDIELGLGWDRIGVWDWNPRLGSGSSMQHQYDYACAAKENLQG